MIQISNLSFGYKSKPLLFEDLNLNLTEGHIYGLLGKNGAGKSTLLKNMAGLAFPAKGKCLYKGVNVSSRPISVLEDIYFIAEELFVPSLTPIQFAERTGCFYPQFSKSNFDDYLKMLNVAAFAAMDKLSFGQQKKAMIAFGLATNTSLLIMDEPTNGLDIPSKVQFRKLMASVLTEERCIIISTHQVRGLDSLIDTLLVLDNREIVVNQLMDEVAEKLTFGFYTDTKELPVLYEEENIRGKNAILKNSGQYGKVDLELLFNAIISNNKPIIELLNHHE
jgi:ABC-2 type transport system ATP-binding protein